MELKRLRIARGWSQEEVASRLCHYGCDLHQTTIARTEAAQRPIRLNEAVAIASLFGKTVPAMIGAYVSDRYRMVLRG